MQAAWQGAVVETPTHRYVKVAAELEDGRLTLRDLRGRHLLTVDAPQEPDGTRRYRYGDAVVRDAKLCACGGTRVVRKAQ